MSGKSVLRVLAALLLGITMNIAGSHKQFNSEKIPSNDFKMDTGHSHPSEPYGMSGPDMAADCAIEPTDENYIGARYKAFLAEAELSETSWLILFAGSGFTVDGEYQPHFLDLMIKASWASLYDDPLCASGFPAVRETWDNFTIQFGLSDYEDPFYEWIHENDIAAWARDPELFPRMFTNIDSTDPVAADKIMAEYQVDKGGTLEGREIEVSLERGDVVTLSQGVNYYMDPDLEGAQLCEPNSQDDILYRHWIATLRVPSLAIDSSVDFYINAAQGDKLAGNETLNFMWENPGRPALEGDRFKVIVFDPEVKKTTGEWVRAERFLVDYRTPQSDLPLNEHGTMVGGYRKVNYRGKAALEMSFGYGYSDYVIDGNLSEREPSNDTKGVIDLSYPAVETNGYRLKRIIEEVAGQPLQEPCCVGLDSSGDVYLTDGPANTIFKLGHEGDFLMKIAPGGGTTPGQLSLPAGIGVDASGRIFVAELGAHRVSVFSSSGEFLYTFGQEGASPGDLRQPLGLAVTPDDNLWVAEWYNGRIQKLSPTGEFLGQADSRYVNFQYIDVDRDGYLYAADLFAPEVFRFSPDGELDLSVGTSGTGDGEFGEPPGVAADDNGNIFVTDRVNNRVQVFDSTGQFLLKFGDSGTLPVPFDNMGGIRVAPDGNVYVVAHSGLYIFEPSTPTVADLAVTELTWSSPVTQFEPNSFYVTVVNTGTARFEPRDPGYDIVLRQKGDDIPSLWPLPLEYYFSTETSRDVLAPTQLQSLDPGQGATIAVSDVRFPSPVSEGKLEVVLTPRDPDANPDNDSIEKDLAIQETPEGYYFCAGGIAKAAVVGLAALIGPEVIDGIDLLNFLADTQRCQANTNCHNNQIRDFAAGKVLEWALPPTKVIGLLTQLAEVLLDLERCLNWGIGLISDLVARLNLGGMAVNMAAVQSPVYILVTNAEGEQVGFTDDGTPVNEIGGAQVLSSEGKTFLFYPGGDTDTIRVKGTATSTCDLTLTISRGDRTTAKVTYRGVPVTSATVGTIDAQDDEYVINVDDDGDGIVDYTIPPDAVTIVRPTVYLPLILRNG
jgi:hypothetical protein